MYFSAPFGALIFSLLVITGVWQVSLLFTPLIS